MTTYCDKCKKEMTAWEGTVIMYRHGIIMGDDSCREICPKCRAVIDAWLQGKAKIVQEK